MGWKKDGSCRWKGTGVVESFRIELYRRRYSYARSYYRVFHNEILLGLAITRPGANHCADEYSRMLLFERIGRNDASHLPAMIGNEIWFRGGVLYPDEQAGLTWIFEKDNFGGHFKCEYLDWEDAWYFLTGSRPPTK